MKLSLFFAFLALTAVFSQEIVPNRLFAELEETLTAVGTLNLTCTPTGPSSPFGIRSFLYETDNLAAPVGTYNGTFALAADGSFTRVVGTINSTDVSVPPGSSLTNFLAYALRTSGSGDLNEISFITRYNTFGGVFNSTQPCNETFVNQTFTFDFRATYGFYESEEPSTDGRNAAKRVTYRAVGTLSINCSAPTTPFGIQSTMTNDRGVAVGTYNGTFAVTDGSFTRVVPPLLVSTDATGGFSLPYFLANGLSNPGTGQLSNIAFITRFDTVGGVLNSTACVGVPATTVYSGIPFEASYGFYSSSSNTPGGGDSNTRTTGSATSLAFSALFVVAAAVLLI